MTVHRSAGAAAALAAVLVLRLPAGTLSPDRYIDVMDRAVGAYSPARIDDTVRRVESRGIEEHGFTRLVANLGILVAKGRRAESRGLFRRMMDLCCRELPTSHARNGWSVGNDFGVKEVVLALLELERAAVYPKDVTDAWRRDLSRAPAGELYSCRPGPKPGKAQNWMVFGAASEQLRVFAGAGGDPDYVERCVAAQLPFFDANGMYRDPHEPMVYDLVTRLQFAVALRFGYDGASRPALERMLDRSEDPTLRMQSVTGEIPYGGRSNQYVFNETFFAALCEFYAGRCKARGDLRRAARFRAAAARALDSFDRWTAERGFRHVKNRHPSASRFGCEPYGYFDKYMVTAGSFAYLGHLLADASVPTADADEPDSTLVLSGHFHRVMVNAGGYTVQLDTDPDRDYDAGGIGRIQRRGCPPVVCLSVPASAAPRYSLGSVTNATPLAIAPGRKAGGVWRYGFGGGYELTKREDAAVELQVDGMRWRIAVEDGAVVLRLTGEGELALVLPAFLGDGERTGEIAAESDRLSVSFGGGTCVYTTDGKIVDCAGICGNRNGLYRRFEARGTDSLSVRVVLANR